jgi:hypothetical protein
MAGCYEGEEMRYAFVEKWWFVMPLYILGGLILGMVDPQLGRWVQQQFGVKPGFATAVSVNLFLPLLAIGLAVLCPRLTTALLGALSLAGAYTLGLAIVYPPPAWDLVTLLRAVPPIMVAACIGYAVLGCLTVFVTRGVKKAGGYDSHISAS